VDYHADTRHPLQGTMFESLGAHGTPAWFGNTWLRYTHQASTVGNAKIVQPKPSLILKQAWVLSLFVASPQNNYDNESGLIREQNMFHIVHSPRFALLPQMKSTFGIGTSDQRFG